LQVGEHSVAAGFGIMRGMNLGVDGAAILEHLRSVASLRQQRLADPALAVRTVAVKEFQDQRFRRTYSDLLAQPAYRPAAIFFLEELYGPHDFSARDAQFERIVPALVRLFPPEIVGTVRQLAELHALSERLDDIMARQFADAPLAPDMYRSAWQATGEPSARRQQIDLMLAVGRSLVRYTRNPLLRAALRVMRGPAELAGLSALQQFLERGFETFRSMPDAPRFLSIVAERESALVDWLFGKLPEDSPPIGWA
jgi:hypothetical protein